MQFDFMQYFFQVISDGLRGEETVVNPILTVARESSKKMKKQLEAESSHKSI